MCCDYYRNYRGSCGYGSGYGSGCRYGCGSGCGYGSGCGCFLGDWMLFRLQKCFYTSTETSSPDTMCYNYYRNPCGGCGCGSCYSCACDDGCGYRSGCCGYQPLCYRRCYSSCC
nr:LOW QUALITY PROTEIN: keratin-associated protein 21-2-like [Camelus dromedarius]